MEDDPFNRIEPSPEDSEESKIRNEVTFDIEVSSESNKKIAMEFFSTMYKKHFLTLFIGGCVAVVILFIAFGVYGSVTWIGALTERRMALNGGLMVMPIAMLLVMPAIERSVYARDSWTLDRLGMQPLGFSRSKGAYLMCLLPTSFLLIGFFDPSWRVSQAFINPSYALFLAGGIPVAIFEELLFRGVYWKYLYIRFAKGKSIWQVYVINAFLFSAIHLPTIFILYSEAVLANSVSYTLLTLVLYLGSYFMSGLVLCCLRDIFKNVLASISYHVVFNVLFFSINASLPWIMIFQGIILLVLLIARSMNWLNRLIPGAVNAVDGEFKKPVLETKLHAIFRVAFWVGNGLVFFYYGSEMARGNDVLLAITSIIAISGYLLLGFLYMKRMWMFKLPVEQS